MAVNVKSSRTTLNQFFLSAIIAKTCEKWEKRWELLCKIFAAAPDRTKVNLDTIVGKKCMRYTSGKLRALERQKQKRSRTADYNAVDGSKKIRMMIEVSGKRRNHHDNA